MNEWQNPFDNQGNTFSLLALILSLFSLILTILNRKQQNFKWEKLNEGNPVINEIRFKNWKELSQEEAHNTNWGYKPTIYSKGESSDRFVLPYRLVLYSQATNDLIPNINPVFTIEEVQNELNRLNINEDIKVSRLFTILIQFENNGKTEIRNFSIQINAQIEDELFKNVFSSNAKINLTNNQKTQISIDFNTPIDSNLPQEIGLEILLSYMNYKNKTSQKKIKALWTSKDNYWSYS